MSSLANSGKALVNMHSLRLFLFLATISMATAEPPDASPSDRTRQEALRRIAANRGRAFQFVAARLRANVDVDFAWRQLDTLLDAPSGDMFWSFPAAGFYFYCRDLLDSTIRARFRLTLGRYAPYRGDTENHFLMHYTFLYLFAQEWPEMTAREWFNGRSSAENRAEARDYLLHWIDDIARHGMNEWDASRYHYFYITPLLTLRDFADDEDLRHRARMTLELLLADMATDYLNGCYVGAHARDGDGVVIDPRSADASAYAGFYFEDTIRVAGPDLAFAAMSNYSAPEIIRCMASDRSTPYVNHELKRSRPRMRYADSLYALVDRYTYMTRDHAIGSIQGGIHQPIQQHSWDVTFAASRPRNTLFGLHPDVSAEELGTFFPEEPELMESGILSTKASYGRHDKWIGGSRYERIGQYRNVLVARYDLADDVRYPHVDLFIPKSTDTIARLSNGWVIARMERSLVGLRVLSSGKSEWIDEGEWWRLRIHDRRPLYLVEVLSIEDISLDRYLTRRQDRDDPPPLREAWSFDGVLGVIHVSAEARGVRLRGTEPSLRQGRRRLFDGPHLQSDQGSGVIELRCSGRRRTLDFNNGTIKEDG